MWMWPLVLAAACGRAPVAPTSAPSASQASAVGVTIQSFEVESGDYRQYRLQLQATANPYSGVTIGAAHVTITAGTQTVTQRFERPFAARIAPAGSVVSADLVIADPANAVLAATTVTAQVEYVDDAQQAGTATVTKSVPTCHTSYSINTSSFIVIGQAAEAKTLMSNGCFDMTTWYLSPSDSTWESLNPECATLSVSTSVRVTGVGSCVAAIRSTQHGLPVTRMVTVGSLEGSPASLSIEGVDGSMPPDEHVTMRSFALWPNGVSNTVTSDVLWSSSNPAVASVEVDQLGDAVVFGGHEGTATITARFRGLTAARLVRVKLSPNTVSVSGHSFGHMGAGYTIQAKASWDWLIIHEVTDLAAWSTSDPSIATVSKGIVTCLQPER
jgi:hypothetical protein